VYLFLSLPIIATTMRYHLLLLSFLMLATVTSSAQDTSRRKGTIKVVKYTPDWNEKYCGFRSKHAGCDGMLTPKGNRLNVLLRADHTLGEKGKADKPVNATSMGIGFEHFGQCFGFKSGLGVHFGLSDPYIGGSIWTHFPLLFGFSSERLKNLASLGAEAGYFANKTGNTAVLKPFLHFRTPLRGGPHFRWGAGYLFPIRAVSSEKVDFLQEGWQFSLSLVL